MKKGILNNMLIFPNLPQNVGKISNSKGPVPNMAVMARLLSWDLSCVFIKPLMPDSSPTDYHKLHVKLLKKNMKTKTQICDFTLTRPSLIFYPDPKHCYGTFKRDYLEYHIFAYKRYFEH